MDKYDEAIAYLTEHPDQISEAWLNGYVGKKPGSCLFRAATRSGRNENQCGCLSTIRADINREAETSELTVAIKADRRIPSYYKDITVDDLPVFAEWQRRLDKELNRAD